MSENVELVRRMQEAFVGSRPELALAFLDPDVVYDASERPDGKVWHGRDGISEAMSDWSEVWEDWEVRAEDYIDAGDDKVLILWHERGRGRESGITIEQSGGNLVTIAGRRVVHMRVYVGRDAALRAAGLG